MLKSGLAFAILLYALSASAQVYRWVDARGTTHFSDSPPPPGVTAELVPIRAEAGAPSPDTQDCYTIRCQGERMEKRIAAREAQEAKLAAARVANTPPAPRGLEFRNYISIRPGMTEGEVLGYAGPPDFGGDQGIATHTPGLVPMGRRWRTGALMSWVVSTWTYMPTVADPYTTTIRFVGGRVSEMERIRKF